MKVTKQGFVKEVVHVTEKVVCNYCEKVIYSIHQPEEVEYITLQHGFGYFSNRDGQNHLSHICLDCYEEIIKKFKIPPTISESF